MIAITKAIPNPKGINKSNKKINDEIHDPIEVPFCLAKFLQGCFRFDTKRSVELYATFPSRRS